MLGMPMPLKKAMTSERAKRILRKAYGTAYGTAEVKMNTLVLKKPSATYEVDLEEDEPMPQTPDP